MRIRTPVGQSTEAAARHFRRPRPEPVRALLRAQDGAPVRHAEVLAAAWSAAARSRIPGGARSAAPGKP